MEPGKYRAKATQDVQFGVSANGNLQIAVCFELLSGEHAGRTISWVGTFGDGKSTEITIKALESCGWKGIDPTEDLTGITDNEVELVVENETGNDGKIYSKVRWVNRPGSGRVKFHRPAEGQTLRAFGTEISQQVRAMRAESGGPAAAQRPNQQQWPNQQKRPPATRNPPQQQQFDDDCGAPPDDFPF
jgi:hypothetical protein